MDLSFGPRKTALGVYDSARDAHLSGYWFDKASHKHNKVRPLSRRAATPQPQQRQLLLTDNHHHHVVRHRSLTPAATLLRGVPNAPLLACLDIATCLTAMPVSRAWYSALRQAIITSAGEGTCDLEITDSDVMALRLLLRPPIRYNHVIHQLDLDATYFNLAWVFTNDAVSPPSRLTTLCSWLTACRAANLHPGSKEPLEDTSVAISSPRSAIVCLKCGVHPLRDLISHDTTPFLRDQIRRGRPSYAAELSYKEDSAAKKKLYQQMCATYWAVCDRYSREDIARRITPAAYALDTSMVDQNNRRMMVLTERQERKIQLDQQQLALRRKQMEVINTRAAEAERHQKEMANKHKSEVEQNQREAVARKQKMEDVAAAAREREQRKRDQTQAAIHKREANSLKKRQMETFARTIQGTLRVARQSERRGDVGRQNNRMEYEKLLLVEKNRSRNSNLEAFEELTLKAIQDMKDRQRQLQIKKEALPALML